MAQEQNDQAEAQSGSKSWSYSWYFWWITSDGEEVLKSK